ncbi:MAG: alpha-amylase family protein [Armatimonadota bacterium]
MHQHVIELSPDIHLALATTDTGEFLGIGQVSIDGVVMRSDVRPIVVRLDTPDGILYPVLKVQGIEREADGTTRVCLQTTGIRWGRGEFADDYDQPVMWLTPDAEPVTDTVELILKPASLTLGGKDWQGFSYAFQFRSAGRQIHRLLVHATWEIGGTITGNTVLSQGQCNMPVYRGGKDAVFTTSCLRTLDKYGSPQANSFQLGPRGGLVQGFDFQYAQQGALLQYWPVFRSISSLLESPPDSDLLHVIDEYRFSLAQEVTTTPKTVLFTAGELADHEARDLWWEARREIYGSYRDEYGITETVVRPELGLKYSTRVDNWHLKMNIAGEEVDSTEVPYAIADRVLPRLAAQGIRRFFPEVMSESDVTVQGMQRKLDNGVHGDLHCSSVCSTHRFLPSEFWGGMKAWKYMADKAHALDIEIGAWFAPHLSPRAAIFQEHPEYRMIGVNGLPAGGGYGFQTITVGDWNTGLYDWVLADLTRWKEEGGLDYLFTDSLSNMGMVQINYELAMRTNLEALGRLYGDIQRIGIKSLSCECISPWLASRFGVADLRGDLMEQNHAVAGQNDFGWWFGEEDMAYGICLMAGLRKRTMQEAEQIMFRAMANRGYTLYEHMYGIEHELADWWVRLNHLYNQALPHMITRRLLPNHAGVAWENGDVRLLWMFKDYLLHVAPTTHVEQLDGQGIRELTHASPVILPAWGVYRIR